MDIHILGTETLNKSREWWKGAVIYQIMFANALTMKVKYGSSHHHPQIYPSWFKDIGEHRLQRS